MSFHQSGTARLGAAFSSVFLSWIMLVACSQSCHRAGVVAWQHVLLARTLLRCQRTSAVFRGSSRMLSATAGQQETSSAIGSSFSTTESKTAGGTGSILGQKDDTSSTDHKKKIKIRRVLSGVQPTGSLHLGNYLGAIRQWVDFQNLPATVDEETGAIIQTENFFCVVDLHAITMPHDPSALAENTKATAALYLAAGINPEISKVFIQSHVPAHAELAWLLNCVTPMNWLERMIQFKDKAKKQGAESVGVGLFTYPTLMAADILLYQADQVPVGEDQKQHLELARDIARRFHDLFCSGNQWKKRCKEAGIPSRPVFVEPSAMLVREGARVMSLTDGTSKMSKSDPSDSSRINLLDTPDVIREKIKRCKTDSFRGIEWDNPDRPEAANLLNIYAAVQPPNSRTRDDIMREVQDMTWGEFKPLLAEAVVNHLEPIQQRYHTIRKDEEYLVRILKQGSEAANEVAARTLLATRIAMGFVPPLTY